MPFDIVFRGRLPFAFEDAMPEAVGGMLRCCESGGDKTWFDVICAAGVSTSLSEPEIIWLSTSLSAIVERQRYF